MGVTARTRGCADDLASACGDADGTLVARVLDAVRATRAIAEAGETPQSKLIDNYHSTETDQGQVRSRVPEGEIAALQQLAGEGQPQAARRVAELLELDGKTEEATQWWRRAAALGDEDATAYVAYCLQGAVGSELDL